jgi:hypothetical protein
VDNSPGLDYVEKVREYCEKYGVKNYRIEHFEFHQGMSVDEKEERIEKAQEMIRQEILTKNYDAWFSWECDQIIPTDAIEKLIKIMKTGNFMMVVHNSWVRGIPDSYCADFGITLINKECLEKYGSLLQFVSRADYPYMSKEVRNGRESWFKDRVFINGGNYIEASGIISPIYHLDK